MMHGFLNVLRVVSSEVICLPVDNPNAGGRFEDGIDVPCQKSAWKNIGAPCGKRRSYIIGRIAMA